MRSREDQNGFTLLEVLVSLAILTIAMAALVQGAGQNTSNQTYLEERTFAHWVAMNRLAEIRLQKTPLATGQTGGTETLGGRDWHWAMDTEETPDGDVLRVDVHVYRESQAGETPYAQLIGFMEVIP